MTDNKSLATCYRYHRQQQMAKQHIPTCSAMCALAAAKADVAAGTARYPKEYQGAGIGALSKDGLHGTPLKWVEHPTDIGLRFVGFCDELAPRRMIDNTGWYTQDDCYDDVMRGVVFQFPARRGESIYVVGYMQGGMVKKGWISTYNGAGPKDSGACLALRPCDMIRGDRGGTDRNHYASNDDLIDACRQADHIAECEAEQAREYDSAWQLGTQYAYHRDIVKSATAEAKALRLELKQARAVLHQDELPEGVTLSKVCGALKGNLESLRADIGNARKSATCILSDNVFRGNLRSAFIEGAGLSAATAKRLGI